MAFGNVLNICLQIFEGVLVLFTACHILSQCLMGSAQSHSKASNATFKYLNTACPLLNERNNNVYEDSRR